MSEWESSYGGKILYNARFLTSEEIKERYPCESDSNMAKLTHEFVDKGYNIIYGEIELDDYNWLMDVIKTAAYLYKTTPDKIRVGCYTDMSESKAIYAAVRIK